MNARSILLCIAIVALSACGRPELSRSEAESAIAKNKQIDALSKQIFMFPDAIQNGQAQGLWERQPNGTFLLRAHTAQEISSISKDRLVPVKPPRISVTVTGIADSPLSEKIKEVQFMWAYDALSPLVRRLAVKGGDGRASFREFDDGWRLDGVQTRIDERAIELSAAEQSSIDQDIVKEQTQQQEIEEFVASSWTPFKTVQEFTYPAATDLKRSASYPAMKIVITDVDVSYGYETQLQTVWFGHMREIGVTPRGQIYLNNRNLVGGYIPEHPEMSPEAVVESLRSAVNEWRLKYRDNLPADTFDRYLAAKRLRK